MRSCAYLLLAASALLSACTGPAATGGAPKDSSSSGPPELAQKTLVVATDTEPDGFGEMFAGGKSGPEQVQAMIHRVLAELDDQGGYVPGVAAELPSVERGTWTVLPDGRSETVWRLRPNVL